MGQGTSRAAQGPAAGYQVGGELLRYWPEAEAWLVRLPEYAQRLTALLRAVELYLRYCHACRKILKAALRAMRACGKRASPPKETGPLPGTEPILALLERDQVQANVFLKHLQTLTCRKLQQLQADLRKRIQITREALRFKSQPLLSAMQGARERMTDMHLALPPAGSVSPLPLPAPALDAPAAGPAGQDPWRQHLDLYAELRRIQREEEAYRTWMGQFHASYTAFYAGALVDLESCVQDFLAAKRFHHAECAAAAEVLLGGAEGLEEGAGSLHGALTKLACPDFLGAVASTATSSASAGHGAADLFAALSASLNEQWVKEGVIYLHRDPGFLTKARQEPVHVLLTAAGYLHGFKLPGKSASEATAGAAGVTAGNAMSTGTARPPADDYWASAKERWSLALAAPTTRISRGPGLTNFVVEVEERGKARVYAFRTLSERDCQAWVEGMEGVVHARLPDGPPLPESVQLRPGVEGQAPAKRASVVASPSSSPPVTEATPGSKVAEPAGQDGAPAPASG